MHWEFLLGAMMNLFFLILLSFSSVIYAMEEIVHYDYEAYVFFVEQDRRAQRNNVDPLRVIKKCYKRLNRITQQVISAEQWFIVKCKNLVYAHVLSRQRRIQMQDSQSGVSVISVNNWQELLECESD